MSSLETVQAFVLKEGRPRTVSIADDIHIFHFEEDDNWREGCLLFVNRNGHHFRVIKEDSGLYRFVKTWNGLMEYDGWMMTNLRRLNPVSLIQVCGVGPQSKSKPKETLCLLPREATVGRDRRAAWRTHLIELAFDRNANSFTMIHPYNPSVQSTFKGKPWESVDAAEWCEQIFRGYVTNREYVGATSYGEVDQARAADKVKEKVLETAILESEMWGMF